MCLRQSVLSLYWQIVRIASPNLKGSCSKFSPKSPRQPKLKDFGKELQDCALNWPRASAMYHLAWDIKTLAMKTWSQPEGFLSVTVWLRVSWGTRRRLALYPPWPFSQCRCIC